MNHAFQFLRFVIVGIGEFAIMMANADRQLAENLDVVLYHVLILSSIMM